MKKKFPEHFPPSEQEFKDLWSNAVFILDANVYLDLYLYSEDTVTKTFDTLKLIKDKIEIPHQIGFEFSKNRYNKIHSQISSYSSDITLIEDVFRDEKSELFKQNLSSKEQPPFIEESSESIEKIEKALDDLKEKLKTRKKYFQNLLDEEDIILDQISDLSSGKIGSEYNTNDLEKIYEEGIKRYKNLIPPGFEDIDKEGNDKYNDLVIWKQMIDISTKRETNIIFITNEKKDDWWSKSKNRIIGPHHLLRKEFTEITQYVYYSYRLFHFLENADKYLEIKTDESAIEEIKTVNERDTSEVSATLNVKWNTLSQGINTAVAGSLGQGYIYPDFSAQQRLHPFQEVDALKRHWVEQGYDMSPDLAKKFTEEEREMIRQLIQKQLKGYKPPKSDTKEDKNS